MFLSVFVEKVKSSVHSLDSELKFYEPWQMLKGKQGTHIDKQQRLYGARNAQTKKNITLEISFLWQNVELLDSSYSIFFFLSQEIVSRFIFHHMTWQISMVFWFLFVRSSGDLQNREIGKDHFIIIVLRETHTPL